MSLDNYYTPGTWIFFEKLYADTTIAPEPDTGGLPTYNVPCMALITKADTIEPGVGKTRWGAEKLRTKKISYSIQGKEYEMELYQYKTSVYNNTAGVAVSETLPQKKETWSEILDSSEASIQQLEETHKDLFDTHKDLFNISIIKINKFRSYLDNQRILDKIPRLDGIQSLYIMKSKGSGGRRRFSKTKRARPSKRRRTRHN